MSQINQVVHSGKYGDASSVLCRLEGGRFGVQLAGESIHVPSGCLHWVLTMESCLLLGFDIEAPLIGELPSIQSDVAAGANPRIVIGQHLQRLRIALFQGTQAQQETFAGCFLHNLQRDHVYLRNSRGRWNKQLQAIFTQHRESSRGCILCVVTGQAADARNDVNPLTHAVRYHFENNGDEGLKASRRNPSASRD